MTVPALTDSRVANIAARTIRDAWVTFVDRFRIVTRRAKLRFEARDWRGMTADNTERIDLYSRAAGDTAAAVSATLGPRLHDQMVWAAMKAVYSGLIQERSDMELAETFFNSITRRIFSTVGVDPRIEFVDTDFDAPPLDPTPCYRTHPGGEDTAGLVRSILTDAPLGARFASLDEDCRMAAERIEERLRRVGGLRRVDRAEVVNAVFYRGKAAYLVGRLFSGSQTVPLALALLHPAEGMRLDAVLLTENQMSVLFSFTRSYFNVDASVPFPLVHFLSNLMPRKRRSEIYISIGYNKHGKTELYRELRRHLAVSGERFEPARGTRGLVMEVFTLPGFDVVVKVIKDRFGAPKQVTRQQVRNRYQFVFRHDRAGRLVDAQEFEHLQFDRARFDPGLLDLLVGECGRSVSVNAGTVHVAHAYIERRVTPLDVYLSDTEPAAAEDAIIDYGQAIKDLAASGIFPGDMLLKNFGVTRHGRVVFYDYDELTRLEDCVFRRMPIASDADDEMSAEPWFSVGPGDVFPEEFATFLGLEGRLRETFMRRHRDVFEASSWQHWQRRVKAGEILDIYPYDDGLRLRPGSPW
jgi:isocitrate dehydrogenase kinase/phosphatase